VENVGIAMAATKLFETARLPRTSVELTANGTKVAGAWDATASFVERLVDTTLLPLASNEVTGTGTAAGRLNTVANMRCAAVAISAAGLEVVRVGGRTSDPAEASSRALVVAKNGAIWRGLEPVTLPVERDGTSGRTVSRLDNAEVGEVGMGTLDFVCVAIDTVGELRGRGITDVLLGSISPTSTEVEVAVRYRARLNTMSLWLGGLPQ